MSLFSKRYVTKFQSGLEAARLDVIMVVSLWNLTGTLAALLPRWFKTIGSLKPSLTARNFTKSFGKMSVRLVNKSPESLAIEQYVIKKIFFYYKTPVNRQPNCWSLRSSWSIAYRRCSNYIFILDITPGFNGLGKDNHKTRRETSKFLGFEVSCISGFDGTFLIFPF